MPSSDLSGRNRNEKKHSRASLGIVSKAVHLRTTIRIAYVDLDPFWRSRDSTRTRSPRSQRAVKLARPTDAHFRLDA